MDFYLILTSDHSEDSWHAKHIKRCIAHSREVRILKSTFSKWLLVAMLDFLFRPGFEKSTSEILKKEGPRNSNQVSKYLPDEL